MGPRGLSVLERLLISLSARPPARPMVIWAIDPAEHGPGRVWRTDQPGWLTMNATAGEVTLRSPDNELLDQAEGPAAASFAEWTACGGSPQLRSAEYPERRHYGRYLRTMFDQLPSTSRRRKSDGAVKVALSNGRARVANSTAL
jgi:uncharacterized NAD(P)/FAD-binding protein YdhS